MFGFASKIRIYRRFLPNYIYSHNSKRVSFYYNINRHSEDFLFSGHNTIWYV